MLFTLRFSLTGMLIFMMTWSSMVQAAAPRTTHVQDNFVVQSGYQLQEFPFNASGGLDYLPNGDLLVSLDDYRLGNQIAIIDANGDGVPAMPDVIGRLTPKKSGSFIKVSPDGTFALTALTAGKNTTHPLFKIDLATRVITQLVDVPFNYSVAFIDNDNIYISDNDSYAAGSPNQIQWINLKNPTVKQTVISIATAPSGPVAVNAVGDVYYIKSTSAFPAPPLSHALYKWESAQVKSALDNHTVLTEKDAQLIAKLDSGYGLVLNAFNQILIADLSGNILRVDEKTGSIEKLSTFAPSAAGYLTHIALYLPNASFTPYAMSAAKLAVATGKNLPEYDNVIAQYTPVKDDSFADQVLSFHPGAGGGGDPADILSYPVGGGVAVPDNSSLVLLGDRDNPNTNSPASIEVNFFNPIADDIRNKNGLDGIVFSNSFWAQGDPHQRFVEPAFIEVSKDANHDGIANDEWYLILPSTLPANLPKELDLTVTLRNYAEFTPTLMLGDTNGDDIVDVPNMDPENFYTIPTGQTFENNPQSYLVDHGSGGGDAFDLRDAVVETAPGVPLVVNGNNEYAYLDRVDFVRLRDALKSDTSASGGSVTADIDAIADAKSGIIGKSTTVSTVVQLKQAISSAVAGDEIIIKPGVYKLTASLNVPVGVSLKGSEGLWTVNYLSDDTIIDGSLLPANTPAIYMQDATGVFKSQQGYGISGIHFINWDIGLVITSAYPTLQANFFENVKNPIKVMNATDAVIVIRNNVFGHGAQLTPAIGVNVQQASVALNHNTFVNFASTAVLVGSAAEASLRDNIFAFNQTAINASLSKYISGRNNVFFGNGQDVLIGQYNLSASINADPSFASSPSGDYRLNETSPVRGKGIGGADPGVYDGKDFYPFDINPGYFVNLLKFPWVASRNDGSNPVNKYSAPAVASMWLTYLWWDKNKNPDGPIELTNQNLSNQQWLFNYGQKFNYGINAVLDRLDAQGLLMTVQTLDPPYKPYHYNFSVYGRTTQEEALNDIAKWIAYPAGGGSDNPNGDGVTGYPVHVPAAVPTGGNYDNWMAVRGVRATKDPWIADRYEIFGFWMNDPNPNGIGENSYKTAEQFASEYFLPLTGVNHADPQFGKWVSILEPPKKKGEAKLRKSKKRWNKKIKKSLQFQTLTVDGMSRYVYVEDNTVADAASIIKAATEGLHDEVTGYDAQLATIINGALARKPLYVNDPKRGDYYLVAFDKPSKFKIRGIVDTGQTAVVALIDAKDGHFKEASWVKTPVQYPKIAKETALQLLAKKLLPRNPTIQDERRVANLFNRAEIKLVRSASNLYDPNWEIYYQGRTYTVTQQGVVVIEKYKY